MPLTLKPVLGAALGWPIRLDREAGFCARLDRGRPGTSCHTALIVLGLVLAWTSVVLCAYPYHFQTVIPLNVLFFRWLKSVFSSLRCRVRQPRAEK